jgi:hypothetical protein
MFSTESAMPLTLDQAGDKTPTIVALTSRVLNDPAARRTLDSMTDTQTQPKFSAEMWAAFWAAPDESRIGDPRRRHRRLLAGRSEAGAGREAYTGKIVALIAATPDHGCN